MENVIDALKFAVCSPFILLCFVLDVLRERRHGPQRIGRFVAVDEAGAQHTVEIWHHVTHSLHGKVLRRIELRTDWGAEVGRLDKGRYEILQFGTILTSSDPIAT